MDIHISVLQNVLLHPTLCRFGVYREISSVWLRPLHWNLNSYFLATVTLLFRENSFSWQRNRKYWLLPFLMHNLFAKEVTQFLITVLPVPISASNSCFYTGIWIFERRRNWWEFVEGPQATNNLFATILTYFPSVSEWRCVGESGLQIAFISLCNLMVTLFLTAYHFSFDSWLQFLGHGLD